MERKNVWSLAIGFALIGLGALFFLGQILHINLMGYLWPFFILGVGVAFFIGMAAGGRSMGPLAVPGSVITAVGLILFIQNLLGIWATWAYAWALIIAAAGVGLVIFGNWSEVPDLRRAGRVTIIVGLTLFFVFGMFFELGASLLGGRSLGGVFWAVALILLGVYILFGRVLFERSVGQVSRSAVPFTNNSGASAMPSQFSGAAGDVVPVMSESGAGTITEEVVGIRQVHYHGLGDLTVLQGEREGLEIEASPAVKEHIRAQVHGDVLEIRYEQDWFEWLDPRYWGSHTIRYTLYVRDLTLLDSAGLGNLSIPSLATEKLELRHSGTGNIEVRRLQAQTLIVRQGGLGNVEIEGRVGRQDVELTGTGSYHARRLESRDAAVRLSGLGSALVQVDETLEARVSGTGSIEYVGNPRVTQQVSGLGTVRRLG